MYCISFEDMEELCFGGRLNIENCWSDGKFWPEGVLSLGKSAGILVGFKVGKCGFIENGGFLPYIKSPLSIYYL